MEDTGNNSTFLMNFGGEKRNELNEVLRLTDDDQPDDCNYPKTNYVDIDELINYCIENNTFIKSLSLNCYSINAKFNEISLLIEELKSMLKLKFYAFKKPGYVIATTTLLSIFRIITWFTRVKYVRNEVVL